MDRLLALANNEKHYKGTVWTLSAQEHRISRLFIEKLKGREIDDALLSSLLKTCPNERNQAKPVEKKLGADHINASGQIPGFETLSEEKIGHTDNTNGSDSIHRYDTVKKMRQGNNAEFKIQRREVTIKNLERELEDKDIEIDRLKKTIQGLEKELDEYRKEVMRNNIYMDIFDQNLRLRKAGIAGKTATSLRI